MTAALPVAPETEPKVFLNVSGLGPPATLSVEMFDDAERRVPGRTARIGASGFRIPVDWADPGASAAPGRIRLRVVFEGPERAAIRFHALYLAP